MEKERFQLQCGGEGEVQVPMWRRKREGKRSQFHCAGEGVVPVQMWSRNGTGGEGGGVFTLALSDDSCNRLRLAVGPRG